MNWSYLAGFVDCDGCITRSQKKKYKYAQYTYSVVFTQHSDLEDSMQKIFDFISSHGIKVYFIRKISDTKLGECKMINLVVKEQTSLIKILELLIPHLLIKKAKAQEALDYLVDLKTKRCLPDNKDRKNRYWTSDEILSMQKLVDDNYSVGAIGKILDRNTNSISQKISKLKKAETKNNFRDKYSNDEY